MSCGCGNVPCRHIVITNNSCDESITVTQPLIGTVEVTAVGPQGSRGPQGPSGSADTGSLIITASSNNSDTITYTKGDGSTFENVINSVATSSLSLKSSINQDVDTDNQYITTIANSTETSQQIQRPGTPLIYRPTVSNNISGEANKAAELQLGLNNQAGSISLVSNLITGNPNYIKTLNQDLYIKVGSSGQRKLYISASNGIETTGHITGTIDKATQANQIYIDYGDISTTAQLIPTYTADGGADGYKNLHVSNNPLAYYYRTTNNISGISQAADELYIGGGANTAGAIFLNSTAGNSYPTYIRSDQNLHFKTTGTQQIISDSPFNISSSLFVDGTTEVSHSGGSTHQIGYSEHIIFNSFTGSDDPGNPAIIYLPLINESKNRQIRFLTDNTLSNNSKEIHIYPNTADTTTIDGASHYELERPYDGVMLMGHGEQWYVIQRKSK